MQVLIDEENERRILDEESMSPPRYIEKFLSFHSRDFNAIENFFLFLFLILKCQRLVKSDFSRFVPLPFSQTPVSIHRK